MRKGLEDLWNEKDGEKVQWIVSRHEFHMTADRRALMRHSAAGCRHVQDGTNVSYCKLYIKINGVPAPDTSYSS